MRFFAVVALLASLAVARPAENGILKTELSCIGLTNETCVTNLTSGRGCCPPLVCGSDHICHSSYH
ncbi:uncharacterized protein BO80DRAFT_449368 [Aspergillus ibericus CBS 121593]|uniref:Uncharacterized protein n=1 Tax=Aspergillus ibericus CBS 121593 TaxID=1448316 RepID=A0A395GLC7_9EURO|nr:hypothetical protein BO80DRAFT_449368 [Aspergillus ibericus CBS 121593]RAK96305.1 hypothetical protein BO80DRAFT_449368 [Aspergillus ibericus CBS 121593]